MPGTTGEYPEPRPVASHTAAVLLETGLVEMVEPVTEMVLEAPAGLVRVRADCADGRVERITFENVPSFCTALDAAVLFRQKPVKPVAYEQMMHPATGEKPERTAFACGDIAAGTSGDISARVCRNIAA